MKTKNTNTKEWVSYLCEDEMVMPSEIDSAFVGIIQTKNGYVACYDYTKSLSALAELNFSEIESIGYIEQYIADSMSKNLKAPLFLNKYETV